MSVSGVSLKTMSKKELSDEDEFSPRYVVNPNESYHTLTRKNNINSVTYTWNDISVWADEGNGDACCGKKNDEAGTKTILNYVSGMVRPKELLALMGSSGAGKTTLLNMLTFRNSSKLNWSGERCINGVPISADGLASISAYIQQDDIFIGCLTPREHLRFHATLRMHSHIPHKQRFARVEEVIQEIGLSECADTIIGVPGVIKGLSGGQRKRLAVASEILTDPPLMFFDEPTTGLDSYMAQSIVNILKGLVAKGKTIVCTIHQPSSEVYALFDRILLMSEGKTAFLGDTKDILPYFDSLGYPCPINYNPADFFIHTLAIRPGNEEACLERAKAICKSYEKSEHASEAKKVINKISGTSRDSESILLPTTKKRSPYKASWFSQFRSVFWRACLTILKDPTVAGIQAIQTVVLALMIGVIYYGQKLDQEGIQNINGALFLIMTNITFGNVFSVINTFWAELPVFMREHHNGMYRTDVYYFAKSLAEMPIHLILPVLYMSIVYYMIGFNSSFDRFLLACLIVILLSNVGAAYGYMISTISSSLDMALGLAPVFIMPFMIFGGTFLNKESIPVYFIWLQYISWFLYGNEALTVNQWRGVEGIACEANSTCMSTGEDVLEYLNFKEDNFVVNIIAIAALMVIFRVLCFIALLRKTYNKN